MSEGKRTYTAEEVRQIVTGLASGRRPGHRPMTDAEFLKLYDPERFEREENTRLLREVLERLSDAHKAQPRSRQWQPKPVPPATSKSGPVDL